MSRALRLGIAGLGTVGGGVLRLLTEHAELLSERAGCRLLVDAVCARNRTKDRGVDLSAVRWFDDAEAMAADPDLDIVVELIGGSDGVALATTQAAIAGGKSTVSANKALLAERGAELFAAAEAAGVGIGYEAAVAGGIPIVKTLREGLAGNRIDTVVGILNGTCNYILTEMRSSGREFGEVLAEAQKLGYAEADPSFDIDGIDAAHKLALLAALAFNGTVPFDAVAVEGIRHVSAMDIAYADALGYRIKLLGIGRRYNGGVSLRVHPCLVPPDRAIAAVEGVFNAVEATGDFVDHVMAVGRGAGAGPTASAVVADIVDIARGLVLPGYGVPTGNLRPLTVLPPTERVGPYYLRMMVVDRPGVIAEVAAQMRDHHISVESLLQRGRAPGEAVPVVIVTHQTREAAMLDAIAAINDLDSVLEPVRMIRIESLAG